ncbi:MAG TPA: FG-GAP repeat protein [Planctomycetota bacterium]|nr:FG-GAP repeat protein [Planctomycetota bacterium]
MLRPGLALLLSASLATPLVAQTFDTSVTADGAFEDFFGRAVGLSADTLAVGVPSDNEGAADTGAVHVFVHQGSAWVLQQELLASPPSPGSELGAALAVQGDVLIAGARGQSDGNWLQPGFHRGAALVFRRAAGIWTQEAFLQPATVAAHDALGFAVALDGDVAVAGAPFADPAGEKSGRVWIFRRVAGLWTEEASLVAPDGAAGQRFGLSVALSGDTLAVGAAGAAGRATESGAVYVFVHGGLGWTLQQKRVAPDGARGDRLGESVALDADTLVAGAPRRDAAGQGNAGALAVFTRTAGVWQHQDWLSSPTPRPVDNLGTAVALQGDLVIAGSPDVDAAQPMGGAALLWQRSAGDWSLLSTLLSPETTPGDSCGISVALDGDRCASGTIWRDLETPTRGAVDIWTGLTGGGR